MELIGLAFSAPKYFIFTNNNRLNLFYSMGKYGNSSEKLGVSFNCINTH
jgi:hypothetical protein